MYSRIFIPPKNQSFFLFGPRGTGKSSWVKAQFPSALYIDLLEDHTYRSLLARPEILDERIPPTNPLVILDEVQKIPAILDEVHRLIEKRKLKFILTGSSARKLKKSGVNLLAGRALQCFMYPLTAAEFGKDFSLSKALKFGTLPLAATSSQPKKFLESYVGTYLKEEVMQEGLTRNLGSFSRFLEIASFSQASILNLSQVATEAQIHRKLVEDYFSILRDLLLSHELPVFSKRAKRELMTKRKFFFFDVGVFRTLRPKGPLDSESEALGPAFETLCLQELMALNHYHDFGYGFYHWRTRRHEEVDLVLYGEKGFLAFEFKSGTRLREVDLSGLKLFGEDYPQSKRYLIYNGKERRHQSGIEILPAELFFKETQRLLE